MLVLMNDFPIKYADISSISTDDQFTLCNKVS